MNCLVHFAGELVKCSDAKVYDFRLENTLYEFRGSREMRQRMLHQEHPPKLLKSLIRLYFRGEWIYQDMTTIKIIYPERHHHHHLYVDVGGFVMLVSYVNGRLDIELQRDLLSNNDYQYFILLEFPTISLYKK